MKLFLMPGEITWWIWLAIASLLAVGLGGHMEAFVAAIAVSTLHTLMFYWRSRSWLDFPVQVRLAYTLCLLIYAWPPIQLLFWVPMLGTFALVLFGYCLMARLLSLAPWNRTMPLTGRLVRRTFFAPPVLGNVRHGLPMRSCPGGVCALERLAATQEPAVR